MFAVFLGLPVRLARERASRPNTITIPAATSSRAGTRRRGLLSGRAGMASRFRSGSSPRSTLPSQAPVRREISPALAESGGHVFPAVELQLLLVLPALALPALGPRFHRGLRFVGWDFERVAQQHLRGVQWFARFCLCTWPLRGVALLVGFVVVE